MNKLNSFLSRAAAPATTLAALLALSACGGGGADSAGAGALGSPAPGIAVGEPSPNGTVDKEAFLKLASNANCADSRNRLYIIDNKQVFWDVAGSCADASYAHRLYGATPQQPLCAAQDSIAGPRTTCGDDGARAMFDTILKNREAADLGLGSARKVERIDVLPEAKTGAAVPFERIAVTQYSGFSDGGNTVARSHAEFEALWRKLHGSAYVDNIGQLPRPVDIPALPLVDFNTRMVVAVYSGVKPNGCYGIDITRTSVADGALKVEFTERGEPTDGVACTQAITYPVSLAIVPRADKASFVRVQATAVPVKRIALALRNDAGDAPYTAVVKDAQALQQLWTKHSIPGVALPDVDFGKSMVVFSYGGMQGVCNALTLAGAAQVNGQLYVSQVDRVPGPATLCVAGIVATGDMIVVDRTDAPVVFALSRQTI